MAKPEQYGFNVVGHWLAVMRACSTSKVMRAFSKETPTLPARLTNPLRDIPCSPECLVPQYCKDRGCCQWGHQNGERL